MANTEKYKCNDGGAYYWARGPEVNNRMVWLGVAPNRSFANLFWGREIRSGSVVKGFRGDWWDLPFGKASGQGKLALRAELGPPGEDYEREDVSGGFGGSKWTEERRATNMPSRPKSAVPTGNEKTGPRLNGVWQTNTGASYYVRDLGRTVVWFAVRPDFSVSHVFKGTRTSPGRLKGSYVDLAGDLGKTRQTGVLTLGINPDESAMMKIDARDEVRGRQLNFGSTVWFRP